MPLSPELVLALAAQCAPDVAPSTLLAVARAESALDPFAIGVNGPAVRRGRARSTAEALTMARCLLHAGRDIDLGLAQINVRNLSRLGLSLEAAFDPCRNIAAGARVLRDGYERGAARHGPGQPALRVALSYYNTGHAERGFANGYVARVTAHAGRDAAGADHRVRPAAAATPPEAAD
ncbi:MAG TPA: lytic transglycosylase domain-containing protein, partial [Sphingomicrobium sp.]